MSPEDDSLFSMVALSDSLLEPFERFSCPPDLTIIWFDYHQKSWLGTGIEVLMIYYLLFLGFLASEK